MAKTATTTAKTATAAPAEPKTCACGCGESVVRTFKQGHDQRLIAKLAQDLVYMDVWDGRCMGILKVKESRGENQGKIDTVSAYVSEHLSEALGTKVYNAAMRAWDLQKAADDRANKKAARKAASKPAKPRQAKAAPSEEAGAAVPVEHKLITKAKASGDDIDAIEAAEAAGIALGATVKVKVGKARPREATIHGMNQAGKVTAIRYKVGKNEITKNEGQFEILP